MQLGIGVKAFIQNGDGKYLFLQRAQPLPDGTGIRWDIPGGRIEPGEKLFVALKREIKEETGMELVGTPSLCMAQEILVPHAGLHVIRLTYTAQAKGTVRLGAEHQQAQWLSLSAGLKLNVDPYVRESLQKLAEHS